MTEFIQNVTSFPTVVFSVLMALMLAYWMLVILGALDIDSLDVGGLFDGAHGALDGAAHGAGEAAGEAAAHAAGHALEGHGESLGAAAQLLSVFGLRGIPCTISVSVVVLAGWTACASLMHVLRSGLPEGWLYWLVASAILFVAMFAGLVFASAALHPLKGKFKGPEGKSNRAFVGRSCTVTTSSVSDSFGQATIEDQEHSLLVQVRCDEENDLSRGTLALIYEYDAAREVYLIVRHEDN